MAERIVSPGVFARERDLSFLPQGIAEIGAAIIGPTQKGPSFVPTVVTSFEDFKEIFGDYDKKYYTPYTVKNYLDNGNTVTIVRVGHLGGYASLSSSAFNLVVSGAIGNATAIAASFPSTVVASFMPGVKNSDGTGAMVGVAGGGSVLNSFSATNLSLTINGANATASFTALTLKETGTPLGGGDGTNALNSQTDKSWFRDALKSSPDSEVMQGGEAPGYMYKYFRTNVSQSFANGHLTAASSCSIEAIKQDFATGTTTISNDEYNITEIGGNSDAASARTPYIQSQVNNSLKTDLFRIYMRADGTATNNHYIVIRDIVKPKSGNSSLDYAMFSIDLYDIGHRLLESFQKLNLDPDSPSYLPKVIGDKFQTVNSDGEITVYGRYPNLSKHIRIGDYKESTFTGTPSLVPMGYAKVYNPINATATVPTASFTLGQHRMGEENTGNNPTTYRPEIPYGFRINENWFGYSEVATNREYLAPIPVDAVQSPNAEFSLENMYGWGDLGDSTYTNDNNFVSSSSQLTISAPKDQLKFAVPFQYGFDGVNPAAARSTGPEITSTNTMGFDCSTSNSSGSLSWKRAINAISNPDEYDINMLVTPGLIHKHHSLMTKHALTKVENRADCFYVMDGSDVDDSVATAVSNIETLDSNYVATYYPWVYMDNPAVNAGQILVPPSVVIPGVIAFTDSVAHEWFAPAGLNRGGLSNVRSTKKKLTHTDRDNLYEGRVNPIASFPGQGVVVFGQKTLQAKPSALDRINVRRLLIRLKKFIASSSRFLVFEQNDSSTRARCLNIVNPFLESVQANSGLSAFKVVMDDSNNTPDVIDRNQLVGQIFIQPTRTAEFIVLDFTVLPTGAAFPE